ncbi:MAG: hypothetical protein ACJ8J0_04180, partial [Longimicrobiaceae bacterium]
MPWKVEILPDGSAVNAGRDTQGFGHKIVSWTRSAPDKTFGAEERVRNAGACLEPPAAWRAQGAKCTED